MVEQNDQFFNALPQSPLPDSIVNEINHIYRDTLHIGGDQLTHIMQFYGLGYLL